MFKQILEKRLAEFNVTCSPTQLDQFTLFFEMLIEKNKVMNLTGITEPDEFAVKHIIDSLSCDDPEIFKANSKLIDIGTGAGFPGIPLAIMHPNIQITLFDSLQKRLKFLEEVIAALNLTNVTTLHGRAEDMGQNPKYREQFDIATSRAVARLPILLEWSVPFVKKGGFFLSLKGAIYKEECNESGKALKTLGASLQEIKEVQLPSLEDKRAILCIKKDKSTPKRYPRKPKEIKTNPL